MQEGLLLVFELEVKEETRSFDEVVSVVLSGALDNLAVIFELVSLQNVPGDIVLKRIVIDRVLIVPI